MPIPLHALLLLSDEDRITRVMAALQAAGYDVRAGYAGTAHALRAALQQRRWDVVIGQVTRPDGLTAQAAAEVLGGRPAAPPVLGLHPDLSSAEAEAATEAGVRAVVEPGTLHRLGTVLASVRAERKRRRRLAPPTRRPLAPDVADHLPVGVFQTTKNGQVVYANAALAALLGVPSADAVIGQDVSEAFGYPRAAFLEAMQRDGEVRALDVVWTRPDGCRLHTREHARALRDPRGAVRFYEGTITALDPPEKADRHEREAGRRGVLLQFREEVDAAPGEAARCAALAASAQALLDVPGAVAFGRKNADPALSPALAGVSADWSTLAALDPTDAATDHALPDALRDLTGSNGWRAVTVATVPRQTEGRGALAVLLPRGRRLTAAERADLVTLARYGGQALDAAEQDRREAEQATADRAQAARAQAVADLSGYAFALDARGQRAWHTEAPDPAWAALARADEAHEMLELICPADRRAVLRAAIHAQGGQPGEAVVQSKSSKQPTGLPGWVRLSFRVGEDSALYGLARDVSAEREALEKTRRRLAAAERERAFLTRFLLHANHRLRTPLTSIIGFAQVMEEEVEGDAREHASLIGESGRDLADHLAAVILLACPDDPGAPLRPQTLDVGEEAKRTLGLLAPIAKRVGLRFEARYPKRPVEATADPAALARLLFATVGAAIQHSEAGTVRVEIARRAGSAAVTVAAPSFGEVGAEALPAARRIAERMGLSLAVSARPGGLHTASVRLPTVRSAQPAAPNELADIAELLPETTLDASGGVDELIALAELPIPEVADVLDIETTLPMLLPVEQDEPPAPPKRRAREQPVVQVPRPVSIPPPPERSSPPDPAAPSPLPDALRVLAVDDSEDNRVLLERMAEDHLQLQVVGTARQALACMAQAQYDVLLLDINLGRNQSGADVLRIARTLPGYADVYAIAFTAHDGPEQRARFAAAGFDAHLSKPFSRESLREVMAGAVGA